jgi:hypothetical protein
MNYIWLQTKLFYFYIKLKIFLNFRIDVQTKIIHPINYGYFSKNQVSILNLLNYDTR